MPQRLLREVLDFRLPSIKNLMLVALAIATLACGAAGPAQPETPAAIVALIHELEAQPPANPPAYVARYQYMGEVVYYVPPRCCDIFGDLYHASGQLICHPDGGLAGRGDGRCPDFLIQRTNEAILWRDQRSRG